MDTPRFVVKTVTPLPNSYSYYKVDLETVEPEGVMSMGLHLVTCQPNVLELLKPGAVVKIVPADAGG